MYVNKAIVKVFSSCCAATFFMEILVAKDPHCANLVTFLHFVFVSLRGFIFTSKFGTVKPNIPCSQYFLLVVLFFVTNVANNYVYTLHVPSTLHMIIRSATSPASMLVSWYAKKQRPKLLKCISSLLITIGVIIATFGGATIAKQNQNEFFYWCIGITILLASMFLGPLTGLQQERLFMKYGKHPDEMLFYTHTLPLPLFLGIAPQLLEKATTTTLQIWIYIVLYNICQFFCIQSVHELATKETFVTVTLILTIRKFVSLVISSIIFKNSLTMLHVIGTIFVAVGTCMYFDWFSSRKQEPVSMKDKKN